MFLNVVTTLLLYSILNHGHVCSAIITRYACERSTLHLSCSSNTNIYILSASYGRNAGPEKCPSSWMMVRNGCHAGSSLSKVRRACHGHSRCSIRASNSVFGDPCWGTHKYLEVRYRCVRICTANEEYIFDPCYEGLDTPTEIACEGSSVSLSCPGSSRIHVYSALYGRNTGRELCPSSRMRVTSGCRATSSFTKAREYCQGRQNCAIRASNSVFGDPCYGTHKYLEVEYRCVYHSRACEGSTLGLSCHHGTVINIITANYGRTAGQEICPSSFMRTTNCGAGGSLGRVRQSCQGSQYCTIQASNFVFGDPCWGTHKYLDVTYSCD